MREIRTSGSEGGGIGNSTGPSYPYRRMGDENSPSSRWMLLRDEPRLSCVCCEEPMILAYL